MLMKRAHLVQVSLYFRKITEGIGKETKSESANRKFTRKKTQNIKLIREIRETER